MRSAPDSVSSPVPGGGLQQIGCNSEKLQCRDSKRKGGQPDVVVQREACAEHKTHFSNDQSRVSRDRQQAGSKGLAGAERVSSDKTAKKKDVRAMSRCTSYTMYAENRKDPSSA